MPPTPFVSRSLDVHALAEERLVPASVLVCDEAHPRRIGRIDVMPWRLFLERLWSDEWGKRL
jgi:hypothetical protein